MENCLLSLLAFTLPLLAVCAEEPGAEALHDYWIGYTEERIDNPGGQFFNWTTQRACLVRADGTERREAAPGLIDEPNAWTQFSGWSPDGKTALVGRGWETPENAAWEREHKTFRMTEGWLFDMFLVNPETGAATNTTSVERASIYNTGLFFWPGDPTKLGFQALIEGQSHPFRMNLDGSNKEDLTEGSDEFAYGFNASPDGTRIAYHMSYKIYVAGADGSEATFVDSGNPFNFCPTWSPDGEHVLFLSGEHYDCHPHLVRKDGTGLRKLADRGGYRGTIETLLNPDFHSESSDIPVWSPDGNWIYYTAQAENAVDLFRIDLMGNAERLTHSEPGVLNYHPKVSPDGEWIVFGSTRSKEGRQQYVMPSKGGEARTVTNMEKGTAAYHAHWRPR